MLLSEAKLVIMVFTLFISGVWEKESSVSVLRGSSVDLPCSAEHPTSNMTWYTVNKNDSSFDLKELPADGSKVRSNMDSTLTIKNVSESHEKFYCCRETTDDPKLCWHNRMELHVADLQVKVFPTTKGLTVTLMCSTSCPLTEKPAAFIWYKNREFLYEDWSPWYQELVSGEEAVRYSCAIKGYEELRAPEVSVDSVTLTCFYVTYAQGRICSSQLKSMDGPCSITYPIDIHVQQTDLGYFSALKCTTSCPEADPHHAYRWHWNRNVYSDCESQDFSIKSYEEIFSCAVKTNEYLHSDEICVGKRNCMDLNYVRRRICALEGSSVSVSSKYSNAGVNVIQWYKSGVVEDGDEAKLKIAGRVEYHEDKKNYGRLIINDLEKNDSAKYTLHLGLYYPKQNRSHTPGVMLVVTGLKVIITPSAEVTEGQRITLTCSTSCPLTDNTNYIWYFNSRPMSLPEHQSKHLVLDPVGVQHTGNYSCAVKMHQNMNSPEEALSVKALDKSVLIVYAVKVSVLLLIPSALFLLYHKIRKKKKTVTATTKPSKAQGEQMSPLYESIPLVAMNPAANIEPAAVLHRVFPLP